MKTAIRIRNLFKSYGSNFVLRDINLEISAGEVIGYIGPNGAGKSTTVKILCGLLTDYEGEVTVNGFDVKSQTLQVKQSIGYVPETTEIYDALTPVEYLQLVAVLHELQEDMAEERIVRFLEVFGLSDHMHQRMDTFSKGMKQKVLLTAGLIHNPDIIILDEPLSGLDANSVILVKDLMARLSADGKTIFYCSHMMDVVEKVSHRIVLIDEGRIVANGTIAELRQQLGEKSLEQIFSDLTGTPDNQYRTQELFKILRNSSS